MALTRIYQVVNVDRPDRVIKTRLTREACEKWLEEESDYSDYMGSLTLTIQEVWTNKSAADIKKLVSK